MATMITEECINCGACEPECPVSAIFEEDDVPGEYKEYVELNARLAGGWPVITKQKSPMDTAEQFRNVKDKRNLLSEDAGG